MESESKSRLVYYGQIIIGFVLYAFFNDTSFIQKASEDLLSRTTRKKALLTVLGAIAMLAVIASVLIVLLGSLRGSAISSQTRANQAQLISELNQKYLMEGIPGQPVFFPVDDQFCVEATMENLWGDHSEPLMPDTLGQAGVISFSISGLKFTCPVYYSTPGFLLGTPSEKNALVFFFHDQTNASETPGEGRYILLPLSKDRFVLDFNQALRMPCSFSDPAKCPELNQAHVVSVPIRAGQMK